MGDCRSGSVHGIDTYMRTHTPVGSDRLVPGLGMGNVRIDSRLKGGVESNAAKSCRSISENEIWGGNLIPGNLKL
jgi:hypothetical protein